MSFWCLFLVTALAAVESVSAQEVRRVFSFTGANGGANPFYGSLIQGADGKLYGTTYDFAGDGAMFTVQVPGPTAVRGIFNGANGKGPFGGLTLATDGNYYGTASYGGASNNGVLFRLTPKNVYQVLHEFQGGTDGMVPAAPPIQAADGNLYGTTFGVFHGTYSTIYRVTPATGAFATLYQFDGSAGNLVLAPLVQGLDGALYGTASSGGASGLGAIFKLSLSGNVQSLYSFPGGTGGVGPVGPLIQASDGNFYGTTESGGNSNRSLGTIFQMTPQGIVTYLHVFGLSVHDGAGPNAGLAEGSDGYLYGTASRLGANGAGTIFRVSKTGVYSTLYSFVGTAGSAPNAALTQHTDGDFYGTATYGGNMNLGTVYRFSTGLPPFAALVSYFGPAGGTAQILGQGFTGATNVTFNGVPAASFTVVSDTFVTAVVPTGATTGKVAVTSPSGTLTTIQNFNITAK